jgi:hypothetical protein
MRPGRDELVIGLIAARPGGVMRRKQRVVGRSFAPAADCLEENDRARVAGAAKFSQDGKERRAQPLHGLQRTRQQEGGG